MGGVRGAAVLAPVVALLAVASPAQALRTHRCPDEPAARCGTLVVPLDRSGVVKGRVPIRFAVLGRLGRKTPLVALSGGPGQAGVALIDDFADSLRPALRGGRALVALDQRGTGYAGVLRCRPLEHSDLLKAGREAGICAQRLGARRDYYLSDDSVADMDALRAALGIARWSVYGVSYGTRVAALYAQRYPARVDRLVLDSIVEPGGPDPLYGTTFQAIPRVLRAVCIHGLCRSVTRDVVSDTGRLVARLAVHPLKGYVVGVRGARKRMSFGRNRLFATLLAGDFDESLRAEYPTALRSALRGDPAPIIRLARRAAQVEGGGNDPHFLSPTLYAATVCTEETFPWDWRADTKTRLLQARAAVNAIPAAQLFPFDRQTVFDSDEVNLCSRWPAVQRPPLPAPGPLPDVPALLVSGQDDLRTPLEGAQNMAALLPHASLVSVPGTGHSVYGSDLTGCSERALARFFANRPVRTVCKRRVGRIRPDGPIPHTLADLRPVGARGKRGRTVAAAARTVYDVLEQSADVLLIDPLGVIRGGGLRGGWFHETARSIRLHGVVFVQGVHVSGDVTSGGAARLVISGPAAVRGRLRIAHGRVVGVLGGERVNARLRSLAHAGGARAAGLPRSAAHPETASFAAVFRHLSR
jgi:pimeloyl-ACP methyl ester carboxylesterase